MVKLLQIACVAWIKAERTQLRKAIKPKQVVAADGSVSYKRPSLASLRKNTKRLKVIEAFLEEGTQTSLNG